VEGSKTVVGGLGGRVAAEWFTELEVTGKSKDTLASYRYVILKLWLPWLEATGRVYDRVERRDVIDFLGHLRKSVSPASANNYLAVVRSWYNWLEAQNYVHKSPAAQVSLKVETTIPDPPPPSNLAALFSAIKTPFEAALAKGLHATGCRVSELCTLRIERIRFESHEATIMGKGGRERVVYFSHEVAELWRGLAGGRTSGYLFSRQATKIRKSKTPGDAPIDRQGAYRCMERLSQRAGVEVVNPHSMRHVYATSLLENGANLREAQELLGHKSILSTQRYTHVARPRLREVYERTRPKPP
jgi:integrase/recombinase XerD